MRNGERELYQLGPSVQSAGLLLVESWTTSELVVAAAAAPVVVEEDDVPPWAISKLLVLVLSVV